MKKVRVQKHGIIHAYAQCTQCGWDAAIKIGLNNRMQKLRNEIYSHVKKTGHRVGLETGKATEYFISD